MFKKMLMTLVLCSLSVFGQIKGASAASIHLPSGSGLEIVTEYPLEHAPAIAYLRAISADGILFSVKEDLDSTLDTCGAKINKCYATHSHDGKPTKLIVITVRGSKPTTFFILDDGHYTAKDLKAKTHAFQEGIVLAEPPSSKNAFLAIMGFEEITTIKERDKLFVEYLQSISKDGSVKKHKKTSREDILAHYATFDKKDDFCQGMVISEAGTIIFILQTKDKISQYTQEQIEEFLG